MHKKFKVGDAVCTRKGKGVVIATKDQGGCEYLVEGPTFRGHTGGGFTLSSGRYAKEPHALWFYEENLTFDFKVGDLVVGNKEATELYSTTVEGWVGEVCREANTHGEIEVFELIGGGVRKYDVLPRCFDKVILPAYSPSQGDLVDVGTDVKKKREFFCMDGDKYVCRTGDDQFFAYTKVKPWVEPVKGYTLWINHKDFTVPYDTLLEFCEANEI